MDDIIDIFIQSYYTEQAQEDLYVALGLFRTFNYLTPFTDIQQTLMQESFKSPETMQDNVTGFIIAGQDYLLDQHGIVLSDESTLAFRNIVLRVLLMLQNLEDPIQPLRVLESALSNHEKYARIMEMYADVPETTFLQMLEEARPVFFDQLAAYLYMQEGDEDKAEEINKTVVTYVRLFKETFGINPAVKVILDSNIIAGDNFSQYVSTLNALRAQITDETMLVELLLFFLLYSKDGVGDPMGVYNDYSHELTNDINAADRLGRVLMDMYTRIQREQELRTNAAD